VASTRKPAPAPVTLRSIADFELGVTMRAESDAAAKQIARELCAAGITQPERDALAEFLRKIATAVSWPNLPQPTEEYSRDGKPVQASPAVRKWSGAG
jgi:hypothetical protein